MGLKRFLAELVRDIGRQYNPMETLKQKEEILKLVKPQQVKGGFIRILSVVCCPCGNPVMMGAEPQNRSEEEIDKLAKEHEGGDGFAVVKMLTPDATEDSETLCASNVGFSHTKCDECGRRFIACWEWDAIEVSKTVKFPWDDPESPEHPSSGLSFSDNRPTSGTVH